MLTLYPEIKPYARHELAVEAPHVPYVDEAARPTACRWCSSMAAGRRLRRRAAVLQPPICTASSPSTSVAVAAPRPHASLENNTTRAWWTTSSAFAATWGSRVVLFGGSWGSTLALAYAQEPSGARAWLILRRIFLCRQQEFDLLYQEGASRLFPDYWEDYIAPIPVRSAAT